MKAILEFDLPEDQTEFNLAKTGKDWALVVWDLDQELRSKLKYSELSDKEYSILEKYREFLYSKLEEYNLSFNLID